MMRLPLLVIALSAVLLSGLGARAAAAPQDNPNALDCKVLRAAIRATVVAHNAKHFAGHINGCTYDDGKEQQQWRVSLSLLRDLTVADAHGYWRQECNAILKAKQDGYSAKRLSKAHVGANACAWDQQHPTGVPPTNQTDGVFQKGLWVGHFDLSTPPTGGGFEYIAFLLKEVVHRVPSK